MELTTTDINELKQAVQSLGGLVEKAFASAIRALCDFDTLLCEEVVVKDAAIDSKEIQVEEQCIRLLCENRLDATDVREVVGILKINNDLERIGDLAVNIAEQIARLIDVEHFQRVRRSDELALKAQAMLRGSLRAQDERDATLARTVIAADDEVDRLQALIQQRIQEEIDRVPENVVPLMQLDFIVRQLERVGDMATNIAEDVTVPSCPQIR